MHLFPVPAIGPLYWSRKTRRTFYPASLLESSSFLRFPLPASRFPLPASRFPLPASRFPLPASRFPLPASRFPLPASRFPLPASRFPLPAGLQRSPCPVLVRYTTLILPHPAQLPAASRRPTFRCIPSPSAHRIPSPDFPLHPVAQRPPHPILDGDASRVVSRFFETASARRAVPHHVDPAASRARVPCSCSPALFGTVASLCALLWPPRRLHPACRFPPPSSACAAPSPPRGTLIGTLVRSAIHAAAGPSCASRLRTIYATFRPPSRRHPACTSSQASSGCNKLIHRSPLFGNVGPPSVPAYRAASRLTIPLLPAL
ncbi:hypothetical protein B0H19DRAFT_1272736 [Mycena capillaripes]|nr:hypothetical protein B0H19DRAFT_1272736 [Mycena capillaripes]